MQELAILILNTQPLAECPRFPGTFEPFERLILIGGNTGWSESSQSKNFPAPERVSTFCEAAETLASFSGLCLLASSEALVECGLAASALPENHRVDRNEITLLSHSPSARGGWSIERDSYGRLRTIRDNSRSSGAGDINGYESAECCAEIAVFEAVLLRQILTRENSLDWNAVFSAIESERRAGRNVGVFHPKLPAPEGALNGEGKCRCCLPEYSISAETGILLEREHALLAVDAPGFNSGQLKIFPKSHLTDFLSLHRDQKRDISELIQEGEAVLRRIYHFDALNIGLNSGSGEHLQVRLIPRWVGDMNFLPLISGLKPVPDSPASAWSRLHEGIR